MKHLHSDSAGADRTTHFNLVPAQLVRGTKHTDTLKTNDTTHGKLLIKGHFLNFCWKKCVWGMCLFASCASTWMRLAAGFLLFSKCFCRCCSWTFRAKPEPRMPYKKSRCTHTHTHTMFLFFCFFNSITWGHTWNKPRRCQMVLNSQLAGRRRRSLAEQTRLIISVRSTSVGSCHRNRWLSGWSGGVKR